MKKYIFLIVYSLQLACVYGQLDPLPKNRLIDSLKTKLEKDSLHIYRFQSLRPYFNLDRRNSFINNAPVNVNGLQLGALKDGKHMLGYEVYTITQKAKQLVKTKTEKKVDVNKELDLRYFALFYQYVAIDRRYFELDIQAEFGIGNFRLKLTDVQSGDISQDRSAGLLVTGLGPIFAIKPFAWIGITGMVGYRFAIDGDPNLNFNGTYYGFGVWIDVRQIIRDLRYLNKKRNYRRLLALTVRMSP
jgi:hypothetical protein